jgi:hypothetical protein
MKNNLKCPSDNIISGYVDGELSTDSEEFNHILNCNKCQKTVVMYTEISKTLQKDINNVSQGITERIKKRVFDKLHCIEFEPENDNCILKDEEFEWLAAGTKKEEIKNKLPKK